MTELREAVRAILLVARFDLGESLRSRKALVLLVLYVVGSTLGALVFVEILRSLELLLADALLVARTSRPGAMTETIMSSSRMLGVLERWTNDPELAASLVHTPPIALFYGWLSMAFLPVLVVLTSAEAISGEVATGSVRFAMPRVDRTRWAVGKALGQIALLAVGVSLGAVAAFVVAAIRLSSFEAWPAATALASYALSALVYGVAWLALALAASQLTSSVPGSRALALLAVTTAGALAPGLEWLAEHVGPAWLFLSVREALPSAHRLDLFRPDLVDRLPATLVLVAFAVAVFAAAHRRFAARDL